MTVNTGNQLTDLMVTRITQLVNSVNALDKRIAKVGPARPLASSEKATTWREITIGGQQFRVLTMEDKK